MTRLLMSDGSFAQHSVTYHRLLLDTLTQVEIWRRSLDLPNFSPKFQERCRAATQWMLEMIDPISGDAPNLGCNDGAFCYQIHTLTYRDFRPSLQLAAVLFLGQTLFEAGPWDEPLYWIGLTVSPRTVNSRTQNAAPIRTFAQGGMW